MSESGTETLVVAESNATAIEGGEERGRPNQPWGLSQKKSERRGVREPKRLKRWAPHKEKGRKPLRSSCGGHTTEKTLRFSVWAPH